MNRAIKIMALDAFGLMWRPILGVALAFVLSGAFDFYLIDAMLIVIAGLLAAYILQKVAGFVGAWYRNAEERARDEAEEAGE